MNKKRGVLRALHKKRRMNQLTDCAWYGTWSMPDPCPAWQFEQAAHVRNGRYVYKPFTTVTDDGWHLTLVHVSLRPQDQAQLPPHRKANLNKAVFLQHGIASNGEQWVGENSHSPALGYFFADQGFQVFLGNSRGTKYSRIHNRDGEPGFIANHKFNYSFQHMGWYDVPANYRAIHRFMGRPVKITYVGHSQGTTQMFVALLDNKTRNFVTTWTERFIAIAPVVYLSHVGPSVLNMFLGGLPGIRNFLDSTGLKWLCGAGCQGSEEGIPWAAAKHYSQLMNTGDVPVFNYFDYGPQGNMNHYRQPTPPAWNVASYPQREAPLHIIASQNDPLATPNNIRNLRRSLGIQGSPHGILNMPCWDHNSISEEDIEDIFAEINRIMGLRPLGQ